MVSGGWAFYRSTIAVSSYAQVELRVLMAVQVDPQHVHYELSAAKFSWDHPKGEQRSNNWYQQTCTCACPHGYAA
jgi:hypothetical protein